MARSLLTFVLAALPAALAATESVHWGMLNGVWRAPDTTPMLNPISRSEVMARAEEWVQKKIPYCQCNGPAECCGTCPFCSDYRCDCSGYVSYTWALGTGYTTFTLPQVSHEISKSDLKPGDIMLNTQDHVVLFGGWADAKNTTYYGYQEPGCHVSGPHYAFKSVIPYPMNWDPDLFKPYRYIHITN